MFGTNRLACQIGGPTFRVGPLARQGFGFLFAPGALGRRRGEFGGGKLAPFGVRERLLLDLDPHAHGGFQQAFGVGAFGGDGFGGGFGVTAAAGLGRRQPFSRLTALYCRQQCGIGPGLLLGRALCTFVRAGLLQGSGFGVTRLVNQGGIADRALALLESLAFEILQSVENLAQTLSRKLVHARLPQSRRAPKVE